MHCAASAPTLAAMSIRQRWLALGRIPIVQWALFVLGTATTTGQAPASAKSPRERVSINDGWRFVRGDPPGSTASLIYDVRPEMTEERDDRPADAQPRPPADVDTSMVALKPWLSPTGTAFIQDPSARPARPGGDPRDDVPYAQPDFDDRHGGRRPLTRPTLTSHGPLGKG